MEDSTFQSEASHRSVNMSTSKEEKISDIEAILNVFKRMQETQQKESQKMQEQQKEDFKDLIRMIFNASKSMARDEKEKESTDDRNIVRDAPELPVNTNHDEWSEEELEGEGRDERPYDPASPTLDPKDDELGPSTSVMPTPPKAKMNLDTNGHLSKVAENKRKSEENGREPKRFKVERDCTDAEEKRRAARELLGDAKGPFT